jgi:hypothetical protein
MLTLFVHLFETPGHLDSGYGYRNHGKRYSCGDCSHKRTERKRFCNTGLLFVTNSPDDSWTTRIFEGKHESCDLFVEFTGFVSFPYQILHHCSQ